MFFFYTFLSSKSIKILYLGGQPTAVFIDLTKHIFGSSDMLQRNGALFEEVRPQQFAEKKDGNGVPASSGGSCHGKVWKACKCKACVKEANNGQ